MLPFKNPELSVEERVADLLSRLTVEEKAGQLTQYFYTGTGEPIPEDFDIESLPPEYRIHVELPARIESAIRAGRAGSLLFIRDPSLSNRLQRYAVEESRLGVPLLFGFDVVHGWRTIFPVPIALAATWCETTMEAAQTVAAREARSAGVHWTFAPMIDIARDPRWGRIIEGAGEDPVLGSAMAAAQVRGFQGDLGSDRLLAGPKHFVGYGAARGGRDYDDAEVSDNELWNVYIPPFRAAIEAGAGNVMSAYMDLNGVPAGASRTLLTSILREKLGFEGFVVSDANAVRSLAVQHFAEDQTDAAARALDAGLDMEMCMFDPAFDNLPAAVADGRVTEAVLDDAVRRVLTAKFRIGLFENPYADETATAAVLDAPEHRMLARTAAEESIVLLKNDDAALPLDPGTIGRIAVVGQLADSRRDVLGPWVFDHDTHETVTIVEGLRSALGSTEVAYEAGAGLPERIHASPFDVMDATIERTPAGYDDDAAIERAVALAEVSDVTVLVVGQRQNQIGENASTSTLDLPGRQLEQLQRIHATGTKVVLVVVSGRPLDLRWADAHVPAIVQAWYPGTRAGEALAAVLLGATSPAGRLPFTWPRHVGQVPLIYAHNRTFVPDEKNERYFEESNAPLYPFGHGLSFTSFEYSNLHLDRSTIARGESTTVSVDVTNVGDRDADEVVQIYIHQRHGTSSRPVRELKDFVRIPLAAGETRRVEFLLTPAQLQYWSAATSSYVQDITTFDVGVGGTSDVDLEGSFSVTR
ncbi:glycoside hydrolase family 3 N-terminal domain-containing protein [Mycolicibacterium sp. P9-22]|uniref:glycoside hydrolase family 3 N-terminal domain-containing protein n=1 Tax=Mycolicibacterium sp. P9-22 TaxID=2024613 RepID=UPI0011EFBCA7|nr:glycoside hydrolase family 3 N-terminal domain-containing protein [Mycolicibacterium sp. P9-22]KAA0120793.1 beta-glucosidase [Mycolicibacterium sp. P9-22]